MPGFAAAAWGISALTGESCLDTRSGYRYSSATLTRSPDGHCVDLSLLPPGSMVGIGQHQATVRADGVMEPSLYLRYQPAPDIPAGIDRLIQIFMLLYALITLVSTIYLCIPVREKDNAD